MMPSMPYEFEQLSADVLLVRWQRMPEKYEGRQFVTDLRRHLDQSAQKLYILSDLRKGYINDGLILQQLSALTQHQNFGAGTAFAHDRSAGIFVSLFRRLSRNQQRASGIWDTVDEAVEYLESVSPGVMTDIEWGEITNR